MILFHLKQAIHILLPFLLQDLKEDNIEQASSRKTLNCQNNNQNQHSEPVIKMNFIIITYHIEQASSQESH